MILENLKTAGVQQAHKDGKINFMSIAPWPGDLVCAEGRYVEGDVDSGLEKRAGKHFPDGPVDFAIPEEKAEAIHEPPNAKDVHAPLLKTFS